MKPISNMSLNTVEPAFIEIIRPSKDHHFVYFTVQSPEFYLNPLFSTISFGMPEPVRCTKTPINSICVVVCSVILPNAA